MYAIVISKEFENFYMLRHIIYNVKKIRQHRKNKGKILLWL